MEKIHLELSGQMLHSYQLEFVHPTTGKQMNLTAELPEYFELIIEKLKRNKG